MLPHPSCGFLDLFLDGDLLLRPRTTYLGLVDIMYAYCYDLRTTEAEHTVESAWTICKLSATMCWDEQFPTLPALLTTCLRRSLAYPLYRSWSLSLRVLSDLVSLLGLGKRAVLKCFLDLKEVMEKNEQAYVVGRMWVEDYCVWLQGADEATIRSLCEQLAALRPEKSWTGWPLDELENEVMAREGEAEEDKDDEDNVEDGEEDSDEEEEDEEEEDEEEEDKEEHDGI
ncbi:Hsp90 cochaperone shq1 [Gonapodya sp. JEL0774]|nr:Hsp90 cochaperone shq1 [Gonapodya sp. JEL0774]